MQDAAFQADQDQAGGVPAGGGVAHAGLSHQGGEIRRIVPDGLQKLRQQPLRQVVPALAGQADRADQPGGEVRLGLAEGAGLRRPGLQLRALVRLRVIGEAAQRDGRAVRGAEGGQIVRPRVVPLQKPEAVPQQRLRVLQPQQEGGEARLHPVQVLVPVNPLHTAATESLAELAGDPRRLVRRQLRPQLRVLEPRQQLSPCRRRNGGIPVCGLVLIENAPAG